jgi:lysophosphatidylglycerol acyltransferase 1
LKWIVDVTVAYPKGEPLDLLAVVFGNRGPHDIVFDYKKYPVSEVSSEKLLDAR